MPLHKRHRVDEPVLNYLGLNNKPKAEVHPEHMRTGSKEVEEHKYNRDKVAFIFRHSVMLSLH